MLWHSGSAGAYKTMLVRFPEHGLSVAVLCNAGESADRTTMFARRIFDLVVPDTAGTDAETSAPGAAASAAGATGVDVTSRVGLFFSERTGEPLRLVVNDDRLRIAGGPPVVTVTADRFRNRSGVLSFMSQDEFELHFVSPDRFELTSMEGEVTHYRRARLHSPTAADLEAFAGQYGSDEMNAVLEIAPGNRGLMVRLNGSQPFEFVPVDPDTFERGRMLVRFRRDNAGRVMALEYSNPLLRNITFSRQSDRTSPR